MSTRSLDTSTQPLGFYMHPVECYTRAIVRANFETFVRYTSHAPYEPGTMEHIYWLTMFEVWFQQYLKHGSAADGREENIA